MNLPGSGLRARKASLPKERLSGLGVEAYAARDRCQDPDLHVGLVWLKEPPNRGTHRYADFPVRLHTLRASRSPPAHSARAWGNWLRWSLAESYHCIIA